MQAFLIGIVAAVGTMMAMSYSAIALGFLPAEGGSIHVLWLVAGNVASLIGAAAVGLYCYRHNRSGAVAAILVWASTTALFMYMLQPTDGTPAQFVALSHAEFEARPKPNTLPGG